MRPTLRNRRDPRVSILKTNPTELEEMQAIGSGPRVRVKYRTRSEAGRMDGQWVLEMNMKMGKWQFEETI